jgi:exonuclease SbcC
MRPVLLEIDGFASYRTRATVDFRDADFFVLVGPTGAGKSTIIDAMVFALYGTVPRWDDRAAVAPALAPTANRGLVRLIFDVGGRRYTAIRDVRRSGGKTQAVTVKEARLEEFLSPDAEGDPDDATNPMASGAPRVTKAVEELLGLDFNQFTQSVALPQGEFARFLHATDGERQAILKNLLGYGIYDDIQRAAHSRATENRLRSETLADQLTNYSDATPEHVTALEHNLTTLTSVQQHIETVAVPALKSAAEEADLARGRVKQLNAERTELLAVVVPDGIDALDSERSTTRSALTTAETEQNRLEEQDQQARADLQAATPRHQLEQTLQRWVELEKITERLPALAEASTAAGTELGTTTANRDRADVAVTEARTVATDAQRASELHQRQVAEAQDGLDALSAVVVPADLDAITQAIRDTTAQLAEAKSTVDSAEAAQQAATDDLEAAPDSGALAAAAADADELHAILAADSTAAAQRVDAATTVANAQATAARTADAVLAAGQAVHDAEHRNQAVAIRADLQVGDDCPVCGHSITELPADTCDTDLAAVREALREAKAADELAAGEWRRLEKQYNGELAVRSEQLRRGDTVRGRLIGHLTALDLGELAGTLGDAIDDTGTDDVLSQLAAGASSAHARVLSAQRQRAALEETRRNADAALTAARKTLGAADDAVKLAEGRAASARTALRGARDRVSALGPPVVDDTNVETAWDQLSEWAKDQLKTLSERHTALSAAAEEAEAAAERRQNELETAETAATQARDQFTAAALAKKGADDQLRHAEQRKDELNQQLSDAPGIEAVRTLLDHVIALQDAVDAVAAALATARQTTSMARDAVAAADAAVETSWQDLRRIRDPLTKFGAPEVTTTDLVAGWRVMADWSAAEAASRLAQAESAEGLATQADERAQVAQSALIQSLTELGVQVPAETTGMALYTQAPSWIASAVATASATLERARERLQESESMRAQMQQAAEEAQVAKELAGLMRTNQFPRWLIASALDTLLDDASTTLMQLSSGQFELTRNDTDLLVIDHNDADMSRLVKTLSGGETFQASLALALALSEQVTSLSAAGASKLESIFLDEGFGTLDENTLDVVAGTLENLASLRSRMVGVITHVAALAERIPVRFEVTRDGAGSHIERQPL